MKRSIRPEKSLSPRLFAQAVGVSESSIKRWVDGGHIRADVTVGGHRRIPLGEAQRFVRDNRIIPTRPQLLDLGEEILASGIEAELPPPGEAGERLYRLLLQGRSAEAIAILASLYAGGIRPAQIIDGPFREALVHLGKLWSHGSEAGIFWEHRATSIAISGLIRLRELLPPAPAGGPLALGAAAPRDPYVIPSLAVSVVLRGVGFSTTDLGPDTPIASLQHAIERERPKLVWLSVTSSRDRGELTRLVEEVVESATRVGAVVVVGGQKSVAPMPTEARRFDSLQGLETFARSLEEPNQQSTDRVSRKGRRG